MMRAMRAMRQMTIMIISRSSSGKVSLCTRAVLLVADETCSVVCGKSVLDVAAFVISVAAAIVKVVVLIVDILTTH